MFDLIIKFIRRHWFIISVTLIGALLRLYKLEANLQFLGDQGRDALVLKRLIIDKDIPFIGPITSVGGFYLGPFYYYLMAPFLWLSKLDPIGPAIATTFIGIFTIPAIFLFTQKLFSKKAAIYTTILYTLASIPIAETRGAWNPNPMPLVVLGLIYSLYQANYKKKPKWLILTGVLLAIALQLHYMIVFLFPFMLWQLILIFKNKSTKHLFYGFLAFLAIMSPIILFEIKHNFLNTKGLFYYFSTGGYGQFTLWDKIKSIDGRSEETIGMILGFGRGRTILRTTITRAILLFTFIKFFKKPSKEFILIATWIISSILALAVYNGSIYPHYLGFVFPAVFILVGKLLSSTKKAFLAIPIVFIPIFLYVNYFTNPVITGGGGNLINLRRTSQTIIEDIKDKNHSQVSISLIDGTRDFKAMNYRYFLEINDIDILEIDQYLETKVLYVVSPYDQPDLLSTGILEIKSALPGEITKTWEPDDNSNIYKIEKL